MIKLTGNSWAWFKDHAHAILMTAVALQNSHLLGEKFSAVLSVVTNIFSALSGTY
jgi:hypothetical protein